MTPKLKNISVVARALGVRAGELEACGPHKAKINLSILGRLKDQPRSRYILVSAICPTALGEGKTVTTIGLSMALNRLKKKTACTLRQASCGPLFGAKGLATGGGMSSVEPAADTNLHFTGDMHAVGMANNILVALTENSVFHGNALKIDPRSISVRRCIDTSDRGLRSIRYQLKSGDQTLDMETGFDITAASEVMSILALCRDAQDLRRRLSHMVVARSLSGEFIRAKDLKGDGLMAALLKDAVKPNLVQTSEGTPCLVHAGPFGNISIGSSSIIADRIALGLCDYVVTESGFGAESGAEKFFDIKCRYSTLSPDACVLVCSIRGLKAQSEKFPALSFNKINAALLREDPQALDQGIEHLKKQIENIAAFGVPVIVALNVFTTDTAGEIEFVKKKALDFGAVASVETTAWRNGSQGALQLAKAVCDHTNSGKAKLKFLYNEQSSIREKIETIAKKIYGARSVEFSKPAEEVMSAAQGRGFGPLPVCIAKTQFSISHDEKLRGCPKDFVLPIREIRVAAGAGFILALACCISTMPGLPATPRGEKIDVDARGVVKGII
ncbi:MAG: formate--tetrahydrofolate ligase [Candidatus Omnitrophota bacterium]